MPHKKFLRRLSALEQLRPSPEEVLESKVLSIARGTAKRDDFRAVMEWSRMDFVATVLDVTYAIEYPQHKISVYGPKLHPAQFYAGELVSSTPDEAREKELVERLKRIAEEPPTGRPLFMWPDEWPFANFWQVLMEKVSLDDLRRRYAQFKEDRGHLR
jgi:hypothetical protein